MPPYYEENEDELFGRSIGKRLGRLTARAKGLARIKIEQLLFEAEFGPDNVAQGRPAQRQAGDSQQQHAESGAVPRGEDEDQVRSELLQYLSTGVMPSTAKEDVAQ